MVTQMAKPPAKSSRRYEVSSDMAYVGSASQPSQAFTLRVHGPMRQTQKKPYDRSKYSHSRKTTTRTTMKDASTRRSVPPSIPAPPSRSPSPPAEVLARSRGNKTYIYTESDREFFYKCIQWELNRDATLGKQALCQKLAEKV